MFDFLELPSRPFGEVFSQKNNTNLIDRPGFMAFPGLGTWAAVVRLKFWVRISSLASVHLPTLLHSLAEFFVVHQSEEETSKSTSFIRDISFCSQ